MLIQINHKNPQGRLISNVVDILKKGGIVAYPTDTYYGIKPSRLVLFALTSKTSAIMPRFPTTHTKQ